MLFIFTVNISGQVSEPIKRVVLFSDSIQVSSYGTYLDTSGTLLDIRYNFTNKQSLHFFYDTCGYNNGLTPRVGISFEASDSTDQYGISYHGNKRDTLILAIPAPGKWFYVNIDSLPLSRKIRFYSQICTVATDTSKYYLKVSIEHK